MPSSPDQTSPAPCAVTQRTTIRRTFATISRWTLLILSLDLAALSLLTTFKAPVWLDWRIRLFGGILLSECGLVISLLPLIIAITAFFQRRKRKYLSAITIALSLITILFLLKPTIQAISLNASIPGQLNAAFGPATIDHPPFSLARSFTHAPPEPVETMEYTDGLNLDFYRATTTTPAPCIISLHGGAWTMGNRAESFAIRLSFQWLAHDGYAVASIDYSLAPDAVWPEQRDDVLAAIRYLRKHATQLNIDPQKIILLGRSAGGQLAQATAYSAHDPGIRGVIALYAPSDLPLSWNQTPGNDSFPQRTILENFLGGTPKTAPLSYHTASGALMASADSPPTLIMHGQLDSLVPLEQSETLATKLIAATVPHALILLPWATHGFDYANFNGPSGQITTYCIEYFLNTILH